MVVAAPRSFHPTRSLYLAALALSIVLAGLVPADTHAALIRQLDGQGQFPTSVDVVNRWSSEDRLDVLVLVEVANTDLGYREESGGLVARLNLEVVLVGPDGEVVSDKRPIRTRVLSARDAGTGTLSQVFGLVLEDVPLRSGRLTCTLFDITRRREGIYNHYRRNNYSSQCSFDWSAEEGPRAAAGLAVEDPLFLVHAPLQTWNPDNVASESSKSDWLQDYVHPSRRYGIEQDALQLAFPVWPPAGGVPMDDDLPGLRVQAFDRNMTYVINDTIDFDRRARAAMAAGRPAWVFYQLDLNLLPEGSFRLSIAPLGGKGRPLLTGFDVVWRLAGVGRHRDRILGEGHVLFRGKDLDRFVAASQTDQELMIEKFWAEHDPDPEHDFNIAYVEFQSRLAYVRSFLGGFGPEGPTDDRGLVHLLLGPPDEVQREHVPMNYEDQDDAQIKVFDRHAPDRESVGSKGISDLAGGPHNAQGGIPMPYSRLAETNRQKQIVSASHNFGFELWKYDSGGWSLFPNRFSMSSMGSRFLFIDRSGFGTYSLESSNLLQGDE